MLCCYSDALGNEACCVLVERNGALVMKRNLLYVALIVFPAFSSGCAEVENLSRSTGMPTWLVWTVLVGALLALCSVAALIGEREWRRFEARLKTLAEGLGLQYKNLKPNDADFFAWEMTGQWENRDVKIEMERRGASGNRQSLMVVSVSCDCPEDVRVEIGYNSFMTAEPTHTLSELKREGGPSLADHSMYAAARGGLDPEEIGRLGVGQVLSDPSMREVGVRVEPDGVRVFYDRRPSSLNWDIDFIRATIDAAQELADYVEERVGRA